MRKNKGRRGEGRQENKGAMVKEEIKSEERRQGAGTREESMVFGK